MEAYQERVVEEKKQLDEKLAKLTDFLLGSKSRSLPDDEQDRLLRQRKAMSDYSDVLRERIAAFS